jgi:hypothetical protein
VAAWPASRLLPSARHLLSEANRISERAGEFVSVEVERVEDCAARVTQGSEACLPHPTMRSGDVAADDFISALATGTSLDIAATDQSRPIATTLASAMDTKRIRNPHLLALSIGEGVSHIFLRRGCDAVHKVSQILLRHTVERPAGFHRNMR